MRSTDKLLVGIVVGAVLLVAAALAVTLLRPQPTYQPEDTPEGVVHNYLLALQQGEYKRAYSYLSPTIVGYPPLPQTFERTVRDNSWQFPLGDTSTALEVLSARLEGGEAVVTVQETSFYQGGLFDSGQTTQTFEVRLRRDPSGMAWKLVDADSYWMYCWNQESGCD
jgi:hypothetical protein